MASHSVQSFPVCLARISLAFCSSAGIAGTTASPPVSSHSLWPGERVRERAFHQPPTLMFPIVPMNLDIAAFEDLLARIVAGSEQDAVEVVAHAGFRRVLYPNPVEDAAR